MKLAFIVKIINACEVFIRISDETKSLGRPICQENIKMVFKKTFYMRP
jgi:hypothetical protein